MNTIYKLLLAISVIVITSVANAQFYASITLQETTPRGDTVWYQTGDIINGDIFSNDCFAIRGRPIFNGFILSPCSNIIRGAGYNPEINGAFIFDVPRINEFSEIAHNLRNHATLIIAPGPGIILRAHFLPGVLTVYSWEDGTPFDSSHSTTYPYGANSCIFCDCPLQVYGIVSGQVTIGSSHDIEIIDDIKYSDANPLNGQVGGTSHNYLGIVSEHDIKIANSIANGRENSAGLGRDQTNRSLTDIVITASLDAPNGCVTFTGQNDPDSGYICDCAPDERGTAYIFGNITQSYHGILHSDNNNGTGYLLNLRYDSRFIRERPPCFYDDITGRFITDDSLDLGNVPIGSTAVDTAHIFAFHPSILGGVNASFPFHAERLGSVEGQQFRVPVSITPSEPRAYRGTLSITTSAEIFQIVLLARGIPAHSPPLATVDGPTVPGQVSLTASPNPFNLTTELRYLLSETGPVRLTLYDLQGRKIRDLDLSSESAGEHSLQLNAEGLASGVYFANLQTGHQSVTRKLLLLK